MRQGWKISVGIVGVGGKVDKDQVDKELDNLESSDPFFPPHSDTSGTQKVVPVHDDVNGQVQSDRNPFH